METSANHPVPSTVTHPGRLTLLVRIVALFLILFFLGRLAMMTMFFHRITSAAQVLTIFYSGLITDVTTMLILLLPVALHFTLPSYRICRQTMPFVTVYLTAVALVSFVLETAGLSYSVIFECRPNRIFFEYLVFPREVFTTVATGFPISGLILLVSLAILPFIAYRKINNLVADFSPSKGSHRAAFLAVFLTLFIVLPLPILRDWPLIFAHSSVTSDRVLNNIAMNSVSSSFTAVMTMVDREHDMSKYYGEISDTEIIKRISTYSSSKTSIPAPEATTKIPPDTTPKKKSLTQAKKKLTQPKKNLVVIIEESLSASFCGHLGGKGLTPRLDELSKEGMSFTHMYSNGDRTVRGLEATISGIVPTAGRGITKLPKIPSGFFSVAALLRQLNYQTDFIYGGDRNFDYMWNFFHQVGFENVYDETNNTNKSAFHGPWGICDGDLFDRAIDVFNKHEDSPFYGYILTTSIHDPFTYPTDGIKTEGSATTAENAVRYADHVLGRFFDDAKNCSWYDNTIFVFVADHNLRVSGPGLIPADSFRIPALIIGPGVPVRTYTPICHQIDLVPTMLSLLDVPLPEFITGFDVLSESTHPNQRNRAFIVTGYTSAILTETKMVVLTPRADHRTYARKDGKYILTNQIDEELARDCKAFAQSTSFLLSSKSFRIHDR